MSDTGGIKRLLTTYTAKRLVEKCGSAPDGYAPLSDIIALMLQEHYCVDLKQLVRVFNGADHADGAKVFETKYEGAFVYVRIAARRPPRHAEQSMLDRIQGTDQALLWSKTVREQTQYKCVELSPYGGKGAGESTSDRSPLRRRSSSTSSELRKTVARTR